ncbi:MAG: HNH endonuclease [Phycisphaerales bacterium]|jgi:5-methylcytosine-specific restriction endonuclease McrA
MSAAEYQSGLGCNVLVLNKHYMAIRIIGAKRAFSLLCRDLAEVVSLEDSGYSNYDFQSWCELSQLRRDFEPDGHDWVSTVNFHIAVPRIIRLLFFDRLPRNEVKFNRRNIFARDKNKCQYCGKRFPTSELSLDHVIPRSMGGKATWANIVCACPACNVKKGGRTPKHARMKLIKKPIKPRRNPLIHVHLGHERYRSWKQFLDHAYWSVELK